MTYKLDIEAFDEWYKKVSKFPMLLCFNREAAKVVMGDMFIHHVTPIYRMVSSNTLSGKVEIYPPERKNVNPIR